MTTTTSRGRILAGEQGIALVLSLFLMAAISVVAASLMFLSQTETYSSMNYRLMSQARYGAESGIQRTVNFLLNSYTAPTNAGADVITLYDTTKSPVQYNGADVVLSANASVPSNYPVSSVVTAFQTALAGTLPSGSVSVSYAPYATLISMQQIQVYGGGGAMQTIQTWEITSDGTIHTSRTATVSVTATLETEKFPAASFAAFSTSGGCGAMTFGGSSVTNSYDSSAPLVGGVPVTSSSGGNVGTNGNLGESGSAVINGTLSTPRVGVGSCSDGNVDALSQSGHATVTGGITQLPQAITMPTPTPPPDCASGGPCTGNQQINTNTTWGVSATYNDVQVTGGTLTLCLPNTTCTFNVNSLTLAGNATIAVASGATVIINVSGSGGVTPALDLTGGSVLNWGFDPSSLQIQYAGTSEIKLGGNSALTAMVYAPNAYATLQGNNDFYGSLVTSRLNVTGNAPIHYDRRLAQEFFTAGNGMLSGFSWQKS